jgi:hypothetical protein
MLQTYLQFQIRKWKKKDHGVWKITKLSLKIVESGKIDTFTT